MSAEEDTLDDLLRALSLAEHDCAVYRYTDGLQVYEEDVYRARLQAVADARAAIRAHVAVSAGLREIAAEDAETKVAAALQRQPADAGEWTDAQCIAFMGSALRHVEYKRGTSGPDCDDIRLGVAFAMKVAIDSARAEGGK